MKIQDTTKLYASLPQAGALTKVLKDDTAQTVFLQGLLASAAPLLFSAIAADVNRPVVFVLQDADEAGYFYHDLTQVLGIGQVFSTLPPIDAP